MALFLKYRPQTFVDLVGQTPVRRTLQNALKAEKPAHAYMFSGSRGTGKTSTARIFAKGLNCEALKEGDPCGTCRFCEQTAAGSLVDVIEIDAASNRGIDEIRDLREKINFSPNVARRKVYIIDEVHMLTKEAFNALLKTLEEPPDHAFFCLATTEIHKIPETILSRCQVFMFQRFTIEQLVDRLKYICAEENFKFEDEALDLVARKAEGGMRDAVSLLEQIAAETDDNITTDATRDSLGISSTESLTSLFAAIETGNTEAGMDIIKSVAQNGQDFRTFGHDFLGFLREQLFVHLKDDKLPMILRTVEEFEMALARLKTAPIIELPFEIAVINLTTNVANLKATTPAPAPKAAPVTPAPTPKLKPAPAPAKVIEPETATEDFTFEAPEPKAMPAPTKASNEHTPTTNSDITPQAVTTQMPAIIEKSGIPVFAKKSFLTTIPEVNGNRIIFYTDSEFHREKLSDSSTHNNILQACKEVFSTEDLTIDFVKKARNVKPKSNIATADDFLSF